MDCRTRSAFALATACLTIAAAAHAQEVSERVIVNVFKPEKAEPSDERIGTLKVPGGFVVRKFASDLGNPRMLASGPGGWLYVTRREQGDVLRLRDQDGDGVAEERQTALRLPQAHGLCIHDGQVYVATVKTVVVCDLHSDGSLGEPRTLIDDLPDGGQHPNRTIAVGPDNRLYVSVGSTCNACNETNPAHAAILRFGLDGSQRETVAMGLRNTIGFGWHPETGAFYGMDHGIDDLGDDVHGEELNLIEPGRHYGWPHVYEDGTFNPVPPLPPGVTKQQLIARNTAPALTYTAHAAPMAMVFVPPQATGVASGNDARGERRSWPSEFGGDALIAMRGSWNRRPPSGYEVVRLRFKDGRPERFEPFLNGFLTDGGRSHFGRPVGLALGADGGLFVSDDTCGVIYRVTPPERTAP